MDPQIYTTLLGVAAGIYFIAALTALGRLLAGPNSMDRLVSLESMIAMSQGMLAAYIDLIMVNINYLLTCKNLTESFRIHILDVIKLNTAGKRLPCL